MNDMIPVNLLCTQLALEKMSNFMEGLLPPMCKIRITGTRFLGQSEYEEGKQDGISCLKVNKELVYTWRRIQSKLLNGSCWDPAGPLAEFLTLILGGCYTLYRHEPVPNSRILQDSTLLLLFVLWLPIGVYDPFIYVKKCSLVIFEFLANNHYTALIVFPVLVCFGLKLPHSAKLPLPFLFLIFVFQNYSIIIVVIIPIILLKERLSTHPHAMICMQCCVQVGVRDNFWELVLSTLDFKV